MQNTYFNALSSRTHHQLLHHFILPALSDNHSCIFNPFSELRTVCRRWRWGRDENGTAAELKLFEFFEFALSESGSRASCARGLFTHD